MKKSFVFALNALILLVSAYFILSGLIIFFSGRDDPLYLLNYFKIQKYEHRLDGLRREVCRKLPDLGDEEKCLGFDINVTAFSVRLWWGKALAGANLKGNYIIVASTALKNFDDEELKFILAHEMGHLLLQTGNEQAAIQFAVSLMQLDFDNVIRFYEHGCEILGFQESDCMSKRIFAE